MQLPHLPLTAAGGPKPPPATVLPRPVSPRRQAAHHRQILVQGHQRWPIETAYFELKSTILGGRVLRARTPGGVDQEVYALLVACQVLRTAIADAAATVPSADPDRASFTIALNAARDQVILAAGVTAASATDLPGTIGRLVLASLLPGRRLRTSPRVVKRAISKYNARGTIDRTSHKAAITIDIITAPLTPSEEP